MPHLNDAPRRHLIRPGFMPRLDLDPDPATMTAVSGGSTEAAGAAAAYLADVKARKSMSLSFIKPIGPDPVRWPDFAKLSSCSMRHGVSFVSGDPAIQYHYPRRPAPLPPETCLLLRFAQVRAGRVTAERIRDKVGGFPKSQGACGVGRNGAAGIRTQGMASWSNKQIVAEEARAGCA